MKTVAQLRKAVFDDLRRKLKTLEKAAPEKRTKIAESISAKLRQAENDGLLEWGDRYALTWLAHDYADPSPTRTWNTVTAAGETTEEHPATTTWADVQRAFDELDLPHGMRRNILTSLNTVREQLQQGKMLQGQLQKMLDAGTVAPHAKVEGVAGPGVLAATPEMKRQAAAKAEAQIAAYRWQRHAEKLDDNRADRTGQKAPDDPHLGIAVDYLKTLVASIDSEDYDEFESGVVWSQHAWLSLFDDLLYPLGRSSERVTFDGAVVEIVATPPAPDWHDCARREGLAAKGHLTLSMSVNGRAVDLTLSRVYSAFREALPTI